MRFEFGGTTPWYYYSLLGNTAKYMPAVMCDVLCVRGGGGGCEWFTTYHSNLVA